MNKPRRGLRASEACTLTIGAVVHTQYFRGRLSLIGTTEHSASYPSCAGSFLSKLGRTARYIGVSDIVWAMETALEPPSTQIRCVSPVR
jgi:hypothetical protein